jgi:hypothetical protein
MRSLKYDHTQIYFGNFLCGTFFSEDRIILLRSWNIQEKFVPAFKKNVPKNFHVKYIQV